MKRTLFQLLKKLVLTLYRIPFVKRNVRGLLAGLQAPVRTADAYIQFGHFKRDDDRVIPLLQGLRDDIKPGWRSMLDAESSYAFPVPAQVRAKAEACEDAVGNTARLLASYGVSLQGKRVLEVGCYDGLHSLKLSKHVGATVTASDMSSYYVVQRPGDTPDDASLMQQNTWLGSLRDHSLAAVGGCYPGVDYVEDDISRSTLESDSFDAICSWEVLEHINDPPAALGHMFRLLTPGGVCFHEYNPFFCLEGGHSLCTLDFHWGHARLTNAEFDRYVETLRPIEAAIDKNFFHQSLNRMSLAMLEGMAVDAGFEVLAILPFASAQHALLLDADVLSDAREVHPSVDELDLISPSVWVILRKPGKDHANEGA